jgi:hypothetical protein
MGLVKFDYILGKLRLNDNPAAVAPSTINLVGLSATYAGLPAVADPLNVGKVAFLTQDDGLNESGFYMSNGVTWSFVNIDLTAVSSTIDPTVNDDGAGGYFVGQSWINTTDGAVFISTDISTGAANWQPVTNNLVDIKSAYASFVPAASYSGKFAILDTRDGVYPSGLYQSNGTIWEYKPFYSHTYSAVTSPLIVNDNANGYYVNDLWNDTVLKKSHILTDSTTGAAVWTEIGSSTIKNEMLWGGYPG